MTDKTERDALVAKLNRVATSMMRDDEAAVWWIKDVREVAEALAAPVEGGRVRKAGDVSPHSDVVLLADMSSPPSASVDVERLRELVVELRHESESDDQSSEYECGEHSARAEVADRLETLIDSAGGAKDLPGMWEESDLIGGETDSREAGSAYANANPQPADGDGAVAGNIPSRLFVHSHPLEPDEKVAEQRKFAAGWNACVSAYEGAAALARPSATAAVPDGFVLVPRVATEAMLIAGVEAGVKATPDPWCPKTWAAMLAAAPAAPAAPAAQASAGVIGDAIRHLSKWLDQNDCECESGHQCGRTEVEQTRDQLLALAQQEPRQAALADGDSASG